MQKVYDQISRVAPTAATVLITGKVGRQNRGTDPPRSQSPAQASIPPVNCGAISPQLIESEVFGHEKGSFTGAMREHKGYFERASGGTLFLDEITEMPVELQVKLLRVLETGLFMRVGSDREMETDVRVIAATNRAPEEAVASGKLREDLLYRLRVFPLHLPRPANAVTMWSLANHFLDRLTEQTTSIKLAPAALAVLKTYHWSGNARTGKRSTEHHHGTTLSMRLACPPSWKC
jgi:DNA-binding NtrC family response regulator